MPDLTRPKPSLDSAPPPAPGSYRRAPEELGAPMAGTLGLTNPMSPAASVEDTLGRAMELEVAIRELITSMPDIAQAGAQFIDVLRQASMAKVQGSQQSLMGANPMAALGAGTPQPIGPGAAVPPPMV